MVLCVLLQHDSPWSQLISDVWKRAAWTLYYTSSFMFQSADKIPLVRMRWWRLNFNFRVKYSFKGHNLIQYRFNTLVRKKKNWYLFFNNPLVSLLWSFSFRGYLALCQLITLKDWLVSCWNKQIIKWMQYKSYKNNTNFNNDKLCLNQSS